MQDRYAGDVGDFGKLGMLRQMADTRLKIGINWFLTYKSEEHVKDDGKHIAYINSKIFKGCDDQLIKKLRVIIESDRSTDALEKANLIPEARYYSAILRPGNEHSFSREIWYKNSLTALADADIIFCDPDNGLLVKSVSLTGSKSDKYVTPKELITYYLQGKSVIFYNHRCREKEQVYLRRFALLQQSKELQTARWMGLKFARGTIRDYMFILQPYHIDKVADAIENMMQSNWSNHFSILDF